MCVCAYSGYVYRMYIFTPTEYSYGEYEVLMTFLCIPNHYCIVASATGSHII